jgi:hypothetical protein
MPSLLQGQALDLAYKCKIRMEIENALVNNSKKMFATVKIFRVDALFAARTSSWSCQQLYD